VQEHRHRCTPAQSTRRTLQDMHMLCMLTQCSEARITTAVLAKRTSWVSSAFCQTRGLVVDSLSTRSITNKMCLHRLPLSWSGQLQRGWRLILTV
jgi:hypothetical protein